jgi:hypothetical protein
MDYTYSYSSRVASVVDDGRFYVVISQAYELPDSYVERSLKGVRYEE